MIKNYLVIAWRNFVKHRTFSIINMIGFSLAMSSCFLIFFHIRSELSYEKNFPKHEKIYRVHPPEWAKSSPPLAGAMLDFFPEVKSAARFYQWGNRVFSHGDFHTELKSGFCADSSAIEMFDLEFVFGSPEKSLRAYNTIVLTESAARTFFGDEDPTGRMLRVAANTEYAITGVIRDLPENTHFKFDYLIPFTTFYKDIPENWTSSKGWMAPYTYVLIEENEFPNVLSKVEGFLLKFYEGRGTPEEIKANAKLEFQPLTDIHLHSHLEQEMSANSNAGYVYIFGAVAVFIIFIASVNFINLNISLAFRRMKETGMRKAMGAFRSQIIRQYLTETMLTSFISFIIALALFFAVLPNYNSLAGRAVQPAEIFKLQNIGIMLALILGVSLISGLYPAIFISSFRPIESLKGQKDPRSFTSYIRKGLVVFQFAASVFMIACTIIIFRQMKYFESTDLGFNKDQIVAVKLYGGLAEKFANDQQVIKTALKSNTSIINVGSSSVLPGDMISVESVVPEGADPNAEFPSFRVIRADYDLASALELKMLEGRNFSPQYNDSASFLINETAAKALNLTHPVGSRITNQTFGLTGTVIGLITDFHFTSLHNPIEPLLIEYKPSWTSYLYIKTKSEDVQSTLQFIEQTLKRIEPSNLFTHTFIDERWDLQYREENKMSALFNAFSIFMIGISCIGLFGLSAIAIEARKKEIGIRKVVGASSQTIVRIISNEFLVMVLLGSAIALPAAWYAMDQWLQKFVFKIAITGDTFLLTLIVAISVAFCAVLSNALKAARSNPVNSLRNE